MYKRLNKISHLERKSPVLPSSRPNPERRLLPPLELLWQQRFPATSVECPSLALCPFLRPKFSGSLKSTDWGDWARNWHPRSDPKREGEKVRVSFHRTGRLVGNWFNVMLPRNGSLICYQFTHLLTIMMTAGFHRQISELNHRLTIPSEHREETKRPFRKWNVKITHGK